MNQPTHIIDPNGEVIIILRNADSPFAQALEDALTGMALPQSAPDVQSPAEVIKTPQSHSEKPSGKKKQEVLSATRTSPEPAPPHEPASIEEPAAEGPTAEEQIYEPLVKSCFYIQVSAKHLIFSSSVFKSILTGGWKESITYMQKGSVEVTAESWDIEAFLILLHAIHNKYHHIPRKLTLEMLAKVAVIADYYECKEAVYIMTDIWINNLEEKIPTTYSRDLILWLWVSWFFQLRSQFREITSTVISRSGNLISGWGLRISDRVIGLMNQRRQEAINDLVSLLHQTREAFLSGSRGCSFECGSIMYGALTMEMQSNNLLSPKPVAPFPNLNYESLTRKISSFTSPEWSESFTSSKRRTVYPHECSDSDFESLFPNLHDSIEGLDLDRLDSL